MDDVLADRLFVKEGVKTFHRAYLGRVKFEQLCDVVDRVVRQPAVLALRDVERGDDGGALGRVFLEVRSDFRARRFGEHFNQFLPSCAKTAARSRAPFLWASEWLACGRRRARRSSFAAAGCRR